MRDATTGLPLFNEALRLDRTRLRMAAPLRVAGVSLVLVGACILTGHRAEVVPLTLGAVLVAVADTGEPPGQRWRTMLWATVVLAAATEAGGLFSRHDALSFVVTILVAAACGFSGAISARAGLVGVLSLVVFCAFSGAPIPLRTTEANTILLALGGLVMTAVTVVPHLLHSGAEHRRSAPGATTGPRDLWARVRAAAVPSNRYFWHAVRLPVAIGIGTVIAWSVPVMHAYWVPVTIAWVTLPDSHLTSVKLVARIAGTLVGALGAAILLLPWLHLPLVATVVIAVGAFLVVSFLFAMYAVAVAGITMVILGLFSVAGDPVLESILERIAATIVAAGIVALVTLTWSRAERRRLAGPDHAPA